MHQNHAYNEHKRVRPIFLEWAHKPDDGLNRAASTATSAAETVGGKLSLGSLASLGTAQP